MTMEKIFVKERIIENQQKQKLYDESRSTRRRSSQGIEDVQVHVISYNL